MKDDSVLVEFGRSTYIGRGRDDFFEVHISDPMARIVAGLRTRVVPDEISSYKAYGPPPSKGGEGVGGQTFFRPPPISRFLAISDRSYRVGRSAIKTIFSN
jgi:hypothetical protein